VFALPVSSEWLVNRTCEPSGVTPTEVELCCGLGSAGDRCEKSAWTVELPLRRTYRGSTPDGFWSWKRTASPSAEIADRLFVEPPASSAGCLLMLPLGRTLTMLSCPPVH
jgi:hypothetical protein